MHYEFMSIFSHWSIAIALPTYLWIRSTGYVRVPYDHG